MKHPLKKLASAVLATALLASCMSVGFLASAAGSYVFTDKFGDNKFPKAVSVFVQGGGATDKCYGFTTNAPMVESMPDDREQVMMKCMTEVESFITYEFKEGFTSFEYIGYGGGGWAGIYGKSGLFKIQWSDTLGGTYRDFKQLVVGPNKGEEHRSRRGRNDPGSARPGLRRPGVLLFQQDPLCRQVPAPVVQGGRHWRLVL